MTSCAEDADKNLTDDEGDVGMLPENQRLPDDLDFRSGYEYAKRSDRLWRRHSVEFLQALAKIFHDLYLRNENRNALGIAEYLRQMLDNDSFDTAANHSHESGAVDAGERGEASRSSPDKNLPSGR